MPTNDPNPHGHDYTTGHSEDAPGYEVTDVNVNGILVFLSGLAGFLAVFFAFCFVMGKVINTAFIKADGPADKWHAATTRERENLANNPDLQQREFEKLTAAFPEPRVDLDDGNQQTADLHAREDLMLNYYSSTPGQDSIRIPIARAMELIVQHGLPVHTEPAAAKLMAGETAPVVQAPLTNGFARTGYEQDVIEARKQKMDFGKATENAEHAALK